MPMPKFMTIDFVAPWGESFPQSFAYTGTYADGSLSLQVESRTGEPLTTASLNLTAYGLLPMPGCIFVGDYSQHKGILEALEACDVLTSTGRTVKFGPHGTTAREARLNEALIAA